MKARSLELVLLIVASLITCFGYVLVLISQQSADDLSEFDLQSTVGAFLGVILGLLVATHIVIRIVAPFADGVLFPIVAFLNGIGYVMIGRLDAARPPEEAEAVKQSAWTFIGVGAFCAVLIILEDPSRLAAYRYSLAVLGVALLISPLLPIIGHDVNGAKIWLKVAGFTIQPGEFAKVVLATFLAGYLVDKRELLASTYHKFGPFKFPAVKHFGPLVVALGLALVVMVSQRDLGSLLLFFTLFMVMFYIATSRVAYVLIGLLMFSGGAYVAWLQFTHVQTRVEIWLNALGPENVQNRGFQIAHALFGIANGGLGGTGLGQGTHTYVPYTSTDMIFAMFAEELGIIGAGGILIAYMFFVGAGFRIANNARSPFEMLLAAGLTALLGFQVFIIVGGILRVLPLTGVTLPFVSYGGSSLIANYVILAILIRISHNSVVQTAEESAENAKLGNQVGVGPLARAKWKAV